MKRKSLILLVIFIFLLVVGCSDKIVDTVSEDIIDLAAIRTKADDIINTYSPEEAQRNLIKLAPIFARVISEDKGFKDLLAFEVAKKFDGDNNVLYDMISSKRTKEGKIVGNLIKNKIQLLNMGESYDQLINSIPYLNISIPANFEQWSTYNGPIYVIPMRYDIQDLEIEALPGYDKNGNVKMFPADTPPDYPVIVLGVNERIPRMLQENSTDQMKPLMEADGETTHAEILHSIKLTTTLEPWYSGAPEIVKFILL